MEILEGIKTRKSIRAFKPNPIARDVLEKILQAVSNSPSYTNTQPWEVVVVSGKKKNELGRKLLELARAKAPTSRDLPTPKGWPPTLEERSRAHGAPRLGAIGGGGDGGGGGEKMSLMN